MADARPTQRTTHRPNRPHQPTTPTPIFSPTDLGELLHAYGDNPPSLPTTLTTLDSILTDFITETCHSAALSASYSRRQKIKIDDFKFLLRRDEGLLGRVLEQMWKERAMKDERKGVDLEAFGRVEGLVGVVEQGGVVGELVRRRGGGAGGRRGKRKGGEGGDGEGRKVKKARSED
ncbi:hypothetical protein LTR78_008273 [Recurvomyces mirabilis]|uniref:Transcription initiation factor TFIID subunit 13 n=1 Tax=Recurvomyces mirabilis TaxID=574656 RepID=A0AAE0TRD5_9PEZI|nr:hypothetical protein LTR78_008273 [Recurvomyces mirabilis]KAK5156558.1 hypothetical protein LTS14_004770 [Recurvomyces mirabilis]